MGMHDGILGTVARVGLVLGGGGITGAAYQMAGLMALELATGWHPNDADVVVGTSGGAFVGAILRCGSLNLDTLVQPHDTARTSPSASAATCSAGHPMVK